MRWAGAVLLLVLLVGCGQGPAEPEPAAKSGPWLVGSATSGGPDGEQTERAYLVVDTETGKATVRELAGSERDAPFPEDWQRRLLVSGDHALVLAQARPTDDAPADRAIPVVALASGASTRVSLDDIEPDEWYFDPRQERTLRVRAGQQVFEVELDADLGAGEPRPVQGPLVPAELKAYPGGARPLAEQRAFDLAITAYDDAGVPIAEDDPWAAGTRLADGSIFLATYDTAEGLVVLERAPGKKFEIVLQQDAPYLEPRFALPPA